MKTSVRWLNQYLDPATVTPQEAEQALTNAGFPIESTAEAAGGDTMIDVEITSNRGDCISHVGLAREVAVSTGRTLRMPAVPGAVASARDAGNASLAASPGGIGSIVALDNRVPEVCSLFTARVIRGVKVGPSPAWMVEALASVGQRSINNVVDVTNYVLHEMGQPTHVFDLSRLRRGTGGANGPSQLIVRYATTGEKVTLLDGKTVELRSNELVVADGDGAVSLAGIMGGLGTEVTERTTDVLLEAATWDPVTVRRAARRLGLRTDASYRFERIVDPRTIDYAARRAASLILQLGGPAATLVPGVLEAGKAPEPPVRVSMRVQRCRDIIGVSQLPVSEMTRILKGHEIETAAPAANAGTLECIVPPHRPDLTREIDLIEEVARTHGLDRVPIQERIPVRVAEPQVSERAMRELTGVLTGLGFFETVTFSFVSAKQAEPFVPTGLAAIQLCDERRKADPILRPSILPSLLACRRANQDGNVHAAGGVRLFEIASVFAQVPAAKDAVEFKDHAPARGKEVETRVLTLIADAVALVPGASGKPFEHKQEAFRLVRGAIESVVRVLGGTGVGIELVPLATVIPGFDPAACADVRLIQHGATQRIGTIAIIHANVQRQYDLQFPVVAAELHVSPLLALYPPRALVHELPQFPGIERDLSLIVSEQTPWASLDRLVTDAKLDRLVGHEFVTTFRGGQLGAGKKSVTLRLLFRDATRTLRHDEVDPQVGTLVKLAQEKLGATMRV